MTARDELVKLLGTDVVITNRHLGAVMARGLLVGLLDEPSVTVGHADGHQSSWPQSFLIEPDLTADARKLVTELETYEEQHGHHDDGWPCLARALEAARAAVPQ